MCVLSSLDGSMWSAVPVKGAATWVRQTGAVRRGAIVPEVSR